MRFRHRTTIQATDEEMTTRNVRNSATKHVAPHNKAILTTAPETNVKAFKKAVRNKRDNFMVELCSVCMTCKQQTNAILLTKIFFVTSTGVIPWTAKAMKHTFLQAWIQFFIVSNGAAYFLLKQNGATRVVVYKISRRSVPVGADECWPQTARRFRRDVGVTGPVTFCQLDSKNTLESILYTNSPTVRYPLVDPISTPNGRFPILRFFALANHKDCPSFLLSSHHNIFVKQYQSSLVSDCNLL